MKFITKLLAVAVLSMAAVVPAQAQFKFGIKAGVAVNELKFNKDVVNSDNRAGFTGGIMAEFTVPLIGVGCDVSALYVGRSVDFIENGTTVNKKRSYIDIPLNLKYKLGLPGVGKIVTPFVTTGPDFSFLMSKANMTDAYKNKKFDFGWNFGFGLQFVSRVQVAASYGLGLSKSASGKDSLNGDLLNGKNRCWTITAAYLF